MTNEHVTTTAIGDNELASCISKIVSIESAKLHQALKQYYDRMYAFECDKLLIELNQSFYKDSELQALLDNVDNGNGLTADDIKVASRYLDFFEPFYYLIKRNDLSMDLIDDMFAYRFFAIINSPEIQQSLIIPHRTYYKNIYRMHKMWRLFRIEKHISDLPLWKTDLSETDKDYYEEMCEPL